MLDIPFVYKKTSISRMLNNLLCLFALSKVGNKGVLVSQIQ